MLASALGWFRGAVALPSAMPTPPPFHVCTAESMLAAPLTWTPCQVARAASEQRRRPWPWGVGGAAAPHHRGVVEDDDIGEQMIVAVELHTDRARALAPRGVGPVALREPAVDEHHLVPRVDLQPHLDGPGRGGALGLT